MTEPPPMEELNHLSARRIYLRTSEFITNIFSTIKLFTSRYAYENSINYIHNHERYRINERLKFEKRLPIVL